ncbi:MAG: hypothetical protein M3384_00360 [Acidobacteriota bacterium]|nr:hypothetical protein [Acidobacteriota bacterium]
MKKIILGINLILLLGAFAAAQKQRNGDVLIQSGTNLEAQLESTLDVKKSKPGDEVVLRTTKAVRQNGQVVVPKGARLIGRVTEVQQKTRQNAASRLDVVFERIQGKNLDAPVRATIVSITQASANSNIGDTSGSDISGSTSSTGNVSSSSGGGGLLGGVGNTVGGVVNTTTQTVGGVTNTAGQTVSGATRTLGRTINGIRISNSAGASADGSTSLSTNGNNLRLEKGITFQLRVSESVQN